MDVVDVDGIGPELARDPPNPGNRDRIQDAQVAPCDRRNRCADPSDTDTGIASTTGVTSGFPVRTLAGGHHTDLMAPQRKTVSNERGNLARPTAVHWRIRVG
jgi:hypothetical protein